MLSRKGNCNFKGKNDIGPERTSIYPLITSGDWRLRSKERALACSTSSEVPQMRGLVAAAKAVPNQEGCYVVF